MPVIALVPDNEHLDKITSNIAEVAARKAKGFYHWAFREN